MLGCEGKIEIPISPKEIFVTFGEIKFLFGVIEITFGEMLVLLLFNRDPELCSSSFTFGSENKLSLHSLNHDLD